MSGPFPRLLGNLAERQNAWLGREDSNLRMGESKSAAMSRIGGDTMTAAARDRLQPLAARFAFQRSELRPEFGNSDVRCVMVEFGARRVLYQQLNKFYCAALRQEWLRSN
jgi:hypothetical protein